MVSALISRLVILIFGTMYPAYSSYKAVKTKDVKEYVKWMMYWIVFALFTSVETFADVLISWMPFYYELKILFVLWLLSPATNGSSILYKKFVHPELVRREQHIDQYLDKVKTQGYSALVQVGTQGFHYAIQTALSSQAKIVDHLRKSYSMNDLSRPAIAGNANRPFAPAEPRIREVDSEEDATDYGEAAVIGAPVNDRTRQQMQNRIPPLAAHHQTDEDDEEERYLHERIAEDNQYLATAAIPPGRSSAAQPGPLSSAPPPMDPYDSRGYNLRSHHVLSSSSGVNMAAVPSSGRRSEVPAAAAAAYAQQEAAAVERPYIHEEGYHYGTLPRRRVLASPAGQQQQQRHSSRASSSRPALPSDWRS